MRKNVAGQKIGAQLVSATDGSAFTGSVTVAVTIDAGTQATGSVGSGACTHEGGGYHTYAPSQAETNGDLIAFTFSGTGAVPVTVQVYTRPTTGLLAPTIADRTLDVSSTGEAGIDWANVGSPTTSLNLSATTISTSQAVASVSGAVGSVTGAVGSVTGNVGGNVAGSVGSVSSGVTLAANQDVRNVSGTLPAVTLATSQPNYAPAKQGDAMALTSGERTTLAGVIWSVLTSALTTAGSIGKLIVDNIDAAISSRLASGSYSAPPSASTVASAVRTELTTELGRIDAAVSSRMATFSLPSNFAALGINSSGHLSRVTLVDTTTTNSDLVTANTIADAVLSRNVSNVEGSAGEHTLCTIVLASLESSISNGTWTIKRTNGTTTHATKTITTDASANPITGVS